MKWRRAQAYESIENFVLEKEPIEQGSMFVVKDLNELYNGILISFGIKKKAKTTKFAQCLPNSKQKYSCFVWR